MCVWAVCGEKSKPTRQNRCTCAPCGARATCSQRAVEQGQYAAPAGSGYFWKVLSTIGVVSVGFMLIVLSTIAYYMVVPLGQRATDDLASIIAHAAGTYSTTDKSARESFAQKMWLKHNLVVTGTVEQLPESTSLLPYLFLLGDLCAGSSDRSSPQDQHRYRR